jgi:hypothetical protein
VGAGDGLSCADADGSGDTGGSAAKVARGDITVDMKTMSVKRTRTLRVTD